MNQLKTESDNRQTKIENNEQDDDESIDQQMEENELLLDNQVKI